MVVPTDRWTCLPSCTRGINCLPAAKGGDVLSGFCLKQTKKTPNSPSPHPNFVLSPLILPR